MELAGYILTYVQANELKCATLAFVITCLCGAVGIIGHRTVVGCLIFIGLVFAGVSLINGAPHG